MRDIYLKCPVSIPSEWVINTLSEDDLTEKKEWIEGWLFHIQDLLDNKKLYGDNFLAAKRFKAWAEQQLKMLIHWLDTLPAETARQQKPAAIPGESERGFA